MIRTLTFAWVVLAAGPALAQDRGSYTLGYSDGYASGVEPITQSYGGGYRDGYAAGARDRNDDDADDFEALDRQRTDMERDQRAREAAQRAADAAKQAARERERRTSEDQMAALTAQAAAENQAFWESEVARQQVEDARFAASMAALSAEDARRAAAEAQDAADEKAFWDAQHARASAAAAQPVVAGLRPAVLPATQHDAAEFAAAAWDALDRENAAMAQAIARTANETASERAARAVELSQQFGVPPWTVESDLSSWEQRAALLQANPALRDNPLLTDWLIANPSAPKLRPDDAVQPGVGPWITRQVNRLIGRVVALWDAQGGESAAGNREP